MSLTTDYRVDEAEFQLPHKEIGSLTTASMKTSDDVTMRGVDRTSSNSSES
jgi:hypothetical protein